MLVEFYALCVKSGNLKSLGRMPALTWNICPLIFLSGSEGHSWFYHEDWQIVSAWVCGNLQVLSEALAKACNMLDVIAGRASGGLKKQPRKPRSRRMSGRRSTWMRVRDPTFREEMYLDPDVDPAIAREHQIFYYRLELIGNLSISHIRDKCSSSE